MTEKLSQNFSEYFKEMRNQHNFNTRESKEGMIFKIIQRTTTYGLNSIRRKAANDWNELLKNSWLVSWRIFLFKIEIYKSAKIISVK